LPPFGTEQKRLICAYDDDNADNAAATWGERLRPVGYKDWNEQLQDIVSYRRDPSKTRAAAEAEYAALKAAHETFISSFPEANTDIAGDVGVNQEGASHLRNDGEKFDAGSSFAP
jgi:hypothetical protein